MAANSAAGTGYLSGVPEFIPIFVEFVLLKV
jgi:hypothetical protein